ncbi:hypothetical protein B0I37DRAFT_411479 [Chaetomium sp. MPI-CAGE-AT-0009]|nr:hypothetical protein B0I37DRAFT_411479 [Chaetomium sp. MPI-CAGE-AT-0009]
MAGDLAWESPSMGSELLESLDHPYLFRTTSPQNEQPPGCFADAPDVYAGNSNDQSPPLLTQARSALLWGGDHMDEVLLSKYRDELMPQHPFVIIPEHLSAAVLNNHHPVLMMSIRVIASFEGLQTMHARMQGVTRHIIDKLFRQSERSLDLLMGIVVILGWRHYHCLKQSNLNNLLCLAESLISDLGLNKKVSDHNDSGDERVIEGQRLMLGVWYLRSSAAMHLQQLTPMPFTLYLRQCLANIQDAKAHDLDEALVYYVKTQYLAERITALKDPQQGRADRGNGGVALEEFGQDKGTQEREEAIAGCRAYLDKLRREVPNRLRNNDTITTQLNTIDVLISEPRRNRPSQTAHTALKNWAQAWISGIPIARYRTLPSHAVFQLLYAVRALIQSEGDELWHIRGSFLDSESRTFALSSELLSPDVFAPIHQREPNPFENEMAVMDRLVAMDASPSDVRKFWAALGEVNEAESTPGDQVPQHSSSLGDFWGLREDDLDEMVIDSSQGKQPIVVGTFNRVQSQRTRSMYVSDMLGSPARGSSAPLERREYSSGALLPQLPMATVPGASQILPTNPAQWTGGETWDHRAPLWGPSDMAPSIRDVHHADIVQQRWNQSHGNPAYGWADAV